MKQTAASVVAECSTVAPLVLAAALAALGPTPGCAFCAGRGPGCRKDTDCKGARVCVNGQCRDPHTARPGKCECPRKVEKTVPPPRPLVLTLPEVHGPWPMFRVDLHRTGLSRRAGPSVRPRRLWRFKTGGPVFSSPAVGKDGTVYFGSHDKYVYAVSDAGRLRWRVRTGDKVFASPTLTSDGKLVVVGSDDDHLYGIDATRGMVRFKVRLGTCKDPLGFGPEGSRCDVDGSAAIAPDGTIVAVGEGVYGLSENGQVKWNYPLKRHVRSSPAVRSDGTVFVGARDDRLYALAKDGKRLWAFAAKGDVDSTPAIGRDGTVYVGSDDGRLYALRHDGVLRWAVLTGGPVRSSPALAMDGTVYFGSHDGKIYAVDPVKGKVKWMFPTSGRIESSVVVDMEGRLYVGSQDGRLYALSADGTLLWQKRLPSDVDSTVAIARDGRLYVGCDDGYLYAFAPVSP